MSKQSTAGNLADLVRILGGEVRGGETKAQLLDKLETLAPQAGSLTQEKLSPVLEDYLSEHVGGLSDDDMAEVFAAIDGE